MTQIFGHRGSAGTHPENTFASYLKATEVGSDGIEIDLHFTKDEELVVIHDATVDRTTNGEGSVRDFTLEEIKMLDAGSWFSEAFTGERIPTLVEVLEFISNRDQLLNIELKNITIAYKGMEERVIKLVKKFNLTDRVIISSFNHNSINKISRLYPEMECAILTLDKLYEPWNYVTEVGATGIHPQWQKTDMDMIAKAQKRNHPVRLYTVNDEDMMAQFIKGNVSAIVTDYPEKALKIRSKLKKELG